MAPLPSFPCHSHDVWTHSFSCRQVPHPDGDWQQIILQRLRAQPLQPYACLSWQEECGLLRGGWCGQRPGGAGKELTSLQEPDSSTHVKKQSKQHHVFKQTVQSAQPRTALPLFLKTVRLTWFVYTTLVDNLPVCLRMCGYTLALIG